MQRSRLLSQPAPPLLRPGPWDVVPGQAQANGHAPFLAPWSAHDDPWSSGPPPQAPASRSSTSVSAPWTPGASVPQQPSVTEELERLGRLRDAGHLTDDEFVTLKRQVLR